MIQNCSRLEIEFLAFVERPCHQVMSSCQRKNGWWKKWRYKFGLICTSHLNDIYWLTVHYCSDPTSLGIWICSKHCRLAVDRRRCHWGGSIPLSGRLHLNRPCRIGTARSWDERWRCCAVGSAGLLGSTLVVRFVGWFGWLLLVVRCWRLAFEV